MLLTELLDKVYPWKWVDQDEGFFGTTYEVFGERRFHPHPGWKIQFNRLEHNDIQNYITGTGDEFKIFSTVVDILKKWTNQINPEIPIYFEALTPSRKKLYTRLSKIIWPSKSLTVQGNFVF